MTATMKYVLIFLCTLVSQACNTELESTLEMNFTSSNKDTLTSIRTFYLTGIDNVDRQKQTFEKVHCTKPNMFILKNVKPG